MIEVKNLVKWYGKKLALDDVSFTVNDGEVLGFLGPNGAGKTTTMNIITGYLSSTKGEVIVDGVEILDNPTEVKKKIGYLPEIPPLYPDMTVRDYLEFIFDLKKIKNHDKKEHLAEISKMVGISEVYERIIKNLSKGYRQRVGLGAALLGYPPVLILDEPTVGLDPKQIIEIRNLIKGFSKKHTVILSSHVLSEIQATCDRVLVINEGKIVANDTPEKLSSGLSQDKKIIVKIDGNKDDIINMLKTIDGIIKIDYKGQSEENAFDFEIEYKSSVDIRRPMALAMNSIGSIVLSTTEIQMSLEDVFLKLTEESKQVSTPTSDSASLTQKEAVTETKEVLPKADEALDIAKEILDNQSEQSDKKEGEDR